MLLLVTMIPRLSPDPLPYTLIVDPFMQLNEKVVYEPPVPSNWTPYRLLDDVCGIAAFDSEIVDVRILDDTVAVELKYNPIKLLDPA